MVKIYFYVKDMNGIHQAIEKSFDEKKGAIWCEKKMCVMVSVTMCAANYKGEIELLIEDVLMVANWPQIWHVWLWDKN